MVTLRKKGSGTQIYVPLFRSGSIILFYVFEGSQWCIYKGVLGFNITLQDILYIIL